MSEPTDADKATARDLLPLLCPHREETAARIARALADAELRGIRKAATVNGSTPYPLLDVLRILCDVADHALGAHSCDHHGYEVWSEARDAGRECLRELTRLATVVGPLEASLDDGAVAGGPREQLRGGPHLPAGFAVAGAPMNCRQARKMSKEWSAFDLDERKRRPRYTRDQLGRALVRLGARFGPLGKYAPGPWKFGRHYAAKVARTTS